MKFDAPGCKMQAHSVALFALKTPQFTTNDVASKFDLSHDAARKALRRVEELGWVTTCEGHTPVTWKPKKVETL